MIVRGGRGDQPPNGTHLTCSLAHRRRRPVQDRIMSSTPLRPIGTIAALPVELKREILRFCDPRTLSIASMASFAFLELASPILYHDVDLASSAALQRFFCPRVRIHAPVFDRVQPWSDIEVSLPRPGSTRRPLAPVSAPFARLPPLLHDSPLLGLPPRRSLPRPNRSSSRDRPRPPSRDPNAHAAVHLRVGHDPLPLRPRHRPPLERFRRP